MLKDCCDAPPCLISKGQLKLLEKPAVAIVGSRSASVNGLRITEDFAKGLCKAGYAVVSGLAKGIDAMAHQAALHYATIGVVAGGVDHVYPKENKSLFHNMWDTGLVLSEWPLGSYPIARHFPQRNRIIAGISECVVVIEAAKKSGTLITAQFALDYHRDVIAVPGSTLDMTSYGANTLIKEGAALARDVNDVLELLKAKPRILKDDRDSDKDLKDSSEESRQVPWAAERISEDILRKRKKIT